MIHSFDDEGASPFSRAVMAAIYFGVVTAVGMALFGLVVHFIPFMKMKLPFPDYIVVPGVLLGLFGFMLGLGNALGERYGVIRSLPQIFLGGTAMGAILFGLAFKTLREGIKSPTDMQALLIACLVISAGFMVVGLLAFLKGKKAKRSQSEKS